jgi:hypothetical protein
VQRDADRNAQEFPLRRTVTSKPRTWSARTAGKASSRKHDRAANRMASAADTHWRPYRLRHRCAYIYSAAMAHMRLGMIAAAVISTSLMVGVPAHADAGSDFLAMVSAQGINPGDTPEDVQLTLATAGEICQLIHFGYTPQVAGRQVKYVFPKATPQQTTGFVDAAQAKLCPVQYTPLQPGGGGW